MKFNVNICAIIGTIAVLLVTAGVICYKKFMPEVKNYNSVPTGNTHIDDEPGSTKSVTKNDLQNLVSITELLNMQKSSSTEVSLQPKLKSLSASEEENLSKPASKQPFVSIQPMVSSPPVEREKSNDSIEGDQPFSYLVENYLNSTNKESGNGGKSGEAVKPGQNGKRKSSTSSLTSSENSIIIIPSSSTSSNEMDPIRTIFDSSTDSSINSGSEGFVKVSKSDKGTQTPIPSDSSLTSINFDEIQIVSAAELSSFLIASIQSDDSIKKDKNNKSTDDTTKSKEAEEKSGKYITVEDETDDKNMENTLKPKKNQTSDEKDKKQSNEHKQEQDSKKDNSEDGDTADSSSELDEDNSHIPGIFTIFLFILGLR